MRFPESGFSYFGSPKATPSVAKDLKALAEQAQTRLKLPPEDGSRLSGQPSQDMLHIATSTIK